MVLREPSLFSNIHYKRTCSFNTDSYYFLNARHGLAYLLEILYVAGFRHIAAPDFNCSVVTEVIEASSLSCTLYAVSDKLDVPSDLQIDEKVDVFLYANYFGFSNQISEYIRTQVISRNIFVIADNAHSYEKHMSDVSKNEFVDASITSLSKSLPVPCGAMVYIKNSELKNSNRDIAGLPKTLGWVRLYLFLVFLLKKISFMRERKRVCLREPAIEGKNHHHNFLHNPSMQPGLPERLILPYINLSKLAAQKQEVYEAYVLWAKLNNLEQLFFKRGDECFPNYFPIRFSDLKERNKFIENHLSESIDTFPWPTMHPNNLTQNTRRLWNEIALLPLSKFMEIK
jgi:hypothetical protein